MQLTKSLKAFYGYSSLEAVEGVPDSQKEADLEMVEMEIESLTSILNQTEF